MGDLTAEERQRFIVRANIAADKREAMEKRKQKTERHLSPPEKQGVFYRFRQVMFSYMVGVRQESRH